MYRREWINENVERTSNKLNLTMMYWYEAAAEGRRKIRRLFVPDEGERRSRRWGKDAEVAALRRSPRVPPVQPVHSTRLQGLPHNETLSRKVRIVALALASFLVENELYVSLWICSVFWWTNETINIWSHIFGWMLFLGLTLYDLCLLNIHAPFGDKIIVALLLVCFQVINEGNSSVGLVYRGSIRVNRCTRTVCCPAWSVNCSPGCMYVPTSFNIPTSTNLQACMILSSMYHTFSCRSEKDYWCFLTFDLFGIALSLLAIYMSGVYYAFWCHKVWTLIQQVFQSFSLLFSQCSVVPEHTFRSCNSSTW